MERLRQPPAEPKQGSPAAVVVVLHSSWTWMSGLALNGAIKSVHPDSTRKVAGQHEVFGRRCSNVDCRRMGTSRAWQFHWAIYIFLGTHSKATILGVAIQRRVKQIPFQLGKGKFTGAEPWAQGRDDSQVDSDVSHLRRQESGYRIQDINDVETVIRTSVFGNRAVLF
jgi:hypothetical protein